MKYLTIFESSIIGFFVGVVVSAYTTFIAGMNGFVGSILSWVSLKPVLDMIAIPDSYILAATFLFYIIVYTVYGALLGALLSSKGRTAHVIVAGAVLLISGGAFFEQYTAMPQALEIDEPVYVASVVRAVPKPPQQYFGNEIVGDLNNDGKDDVAFVISRIDQDRGTLYYLASALTVDEGRLGTNLIFIGEQIEPQQIILDNGLISVSYRDLTDSQSTTTLSVSAHIIDGVLTQVDK